MAGDDGTFTVSDRQWEAMETVVRRAAGVQVTHVVRSPEGDAAIAKVQANALHRRGWINFSADGKTCWPTEGGRKALATHQRLEAPDD